MKVAFIGASGYGNIGDDTYPILWRKYLPKVQVEIFNSNRPENGLDADTILIVFGGGGLMWYEEGDAHFEYMSYYVEEADRLGIPFGFLCSDFQFDRDPHQADGFSKESVLAKWLPVLRRARFIQLRSRRSVEILKKEGIPSDYAPDLAYLFRPTDLMKPAELITVVPAGVVEAQNPTVIDDLNAALKKWPDARLLFVNMGGPVGDEKTASFQSLYPESTALLSNDVNPVRVLDIIGRSHLVLTGRYHGMVFARNCGTPYRTYPGAPYKIAVEPPKNECGDAWRNLTLLKEILREMESSQ